MKGFQRTLEFKRYTDIDLFNADVLDILLEDEVLNNLPVSIVLGSSWRSGDFNIADWLLGAVTDEHGNIVLIAICTKPFNILLNEPAGKPHEGSVEFLASELKRIGFNPPGVLATPGLARRFAGAYCGETGFNQKTTMIIMRLDELAEYKKSPGICRVLTEDDLLFAPSWEHEFCVDCDLPLYTRKENEDRIKTRLGKDTHFIWEDGQPVAQAVHGRNTPNGAVLSWVYTPPQYRGRGYATSVVAEVSKSMFERGKRFCCLFADAANPASCAVYHKLGYYDVCRFEELKFDI